MSLKTSTGQTNLISRTCRCLRTAAGGLGWRARSLKVDFGRWLRNSDDALKEQATQAGVSFDSGPTSAQAAVTQLDADTLSDRGVIIAGNPESCINTIKVYDELGVDEVMMIMQTETIPHERVMESIELFGKEVIPAFSKKATTPVAG